MVKCTAGSGERIFQSTPERWGDPLLAQSEQCTPVTGATLSWCMFYHPGPAHSHHADGEHRAGLAPLGSRRKESPWSLHMHEAGLSVPQNDPCPPWDS